MHVNNKFQGRQREQANTITPNLNMVFYRAQKILIMLSEVSPPSKPSTPSGSDSNTIKIFARIRPSKHAGNNNNNNNDNPNHRRYSLDQAEPGLQNTPQLHFHMPKDETQGLINNSRENYDYRFHRVFDQITKQEEVFDVIAKPVVDKYVS